MEKKMLVPGLLVSVFVIFISLYPALASNGLPSFDKTWQCDGSNLCNYNSGQQVWTCTDHLSCNMGPGDYGCSYRTQLMADGCWGPYCYRESQHTFTAPRAGNYSCEIKATVSYFDHREGSPQYNEKSDVYLNGVKVGTTDDPCCPDTGSCPTSGNGNGDECHTYGTETSCEGNGCGWYEFTWYSTGLKRSRCEEIACEDVSNHPCNPFSQYFPSGYNVPNNDGCCSCWIHGAWCGDCSASDPSRTCHTDSVKHCGDMMFYRHYCTNFAPAGSSIQCVFDNSNEVLVGEGSRTCGQIADMSDDDITKYSNLLLMRHFGVDESDTNYICCFATNVPIGDYCVRNSECESGNCDTTNHVCIEGKKKCGETCSTTDGSDCISGYCTGGVCTDAIGEICNPNRDWCKNNCKRKCSRSCTDDRQCAGGDVKCEGTPGECTCPEGKACTGSPNYECVSTP